MYDMEEMLVKLQAAAGACASKCLQAQVSGLLWESGVEANSPHYFADGLRAHSQGPAPTNEPQKGPSGLGCGSDRFLPPAPAQEES